jgi:Histidine kinase-, DNA gyrase B-, and HSP90-like ATPase
LATTSGVFFDQRFLDLHAGSIISDISVAIVELVANAWDAYATDVEITWPNKSDNTCFSITDNGTGMTPAQFDQRWRVIDYNRVADEGDKVDPPNDLKGHAQRRLTGVTGAAGMQGFASLIPTSSEHGETGRRPLMKSGADQRSRSMSRSSTQGRMSRDMGRR